MSEPYKLYIQQIAYDGASYSYGTAIDPLAKYHIACAECPFVLFPESKELPSRDWADEDGLDEYIPQQLMLKDYDMTVKFLYMRTRGGQVTDETIRADIKNFLSFLYGRTGSGETGDAVRSARLAIWSEDTGIGRKDVRVKKVGSNTYYHTRYDDDVVLEFEVTFQVNDPITDVALSYNSGKFIGLRWN